MSVEPDSPSPRARALALLASAAGMLVVGWAIYTLTNPAVRTPFTETPAPTSSAQTDASPLPAQPTAPRGPRPVSSAPEPAAAPDPGPEVLDEASAYLPPPTAPDPLEQRSIAAYLKNRPAMIAPARLETRAEEALARLDALPDPPLQPGSDEIADLTGIWDEFDRLRTTASYLAGEDGAAHGVDTDAYAATLEHLDAKYRAAQAAWRDRQVEATE